ncbi:MAG: flavodoxin domain-containing protein [Thermoproteota archaeon]|nr:FprA family A-type flavoprotein [Candidatus Brockarchaeota archaeon]
MLKVIIVYESKYGNTETVAETIAEGIREEEGEAFVSEVNRLDLNKITEYDAILIGSPNHIGGPTRSIRSFIDKLGMLRLNGKKFAVFDTYMGGDFGKAVGKMERQIGEKAPGLIRIASGLSVRVQGIKGPIAEGELPKCREFGIRIAAQLKSGASRIC